MSSKLERVVKGLPTVERVNAGLFDKQIKRALIDYILHCGIGLHRDEIAGDVNGELKDFVCKVVEYNQLFEKDIELYEIIKGRMIEFLYEIEESTFNVKFKDEIITKTITF